LKEAINFSIEAKVPFYNIDRDPRERRGYFAIVCYVNECDDISGGGEARGEE
jgi:hypothetical protein